MFKLKYKVRKKINMTGKIRYLRGKQRSQSWRKQVRIDITDKEGQTREETQEKALWENRATHGKAWFEDEPNKVETSQEEQRQNLHKFKRCIVVKPNLAFLSRKICL